jgi:hypothetical protein
MIPPLGGLSDDRCPTRVDGDEIRGQHRMD